MSTESPKQIAYQAWGISQEWMRKVEQWEADCQPLFRALEETKEANQLKVLKALQEARMSDSSFVGSSGYGYDDRGREQLEQVYAQVFETEAALVRPQWCAGTQALAATFFGCLRPAQILLSVTGKPYDTLNRVIGLDKEHQQEGSLCDFGIGYAEVALSAETGGLDREAILSKIAELEAQPEDQGRIGMIFFQRSRGYAQRRALHVQEIGDCIQAIRQTFPQGKWVFVVDNCYGEFTEVHEPTAVGADLCVGSLIKNPGGGLAQTGAYVAGKASLVEQVANRLYAPGLATHVGPMLGQTKAFVQGLYLAPHVVCECLKGLVLAAKIFESQGFETSPAFDEQRSDIIQTLSFHRPDAMIAFCQAVQAASPIDSFVKPEPWAMPGYDAEVIMAAGAFVQGASIELSADGPLKPPYTAYLQGGLVYENVKLAALLACQKMGEGTGEAMRQSCGSAAESFRVLEQGSLA